MTGNGAAPWVRSGTLEWTIVCGSLRSGHDLKSGTLPWIGGRRTTLPSAAAKCASRNHRAFPMVFRFGVQRLFCITAERIRRAWQSGGAGSMVNFTLGQLSAVHRRLHSVVCAGASSRSRQGAKTMKKERFAIAVRSRSMKCITWSIVWCCTQGMEALRSG